MVYNNWIIYGSKWNSLKPHIMENQMKKNVILNLTLACLLALPALAMPPREGITEPEVLRKMRLLGMDSPEGGLIQQLRAKDPGAKISGSRQYPVILGYFTDLANTNSQAEFQTMLFTTAAGAKSVNNYYRDMSYNAMSCSGKVDNWRTSNNTVAYYSVNYGLNGGTAANTYEFIRKVLIHADSTFNFADSNYDKNHDGYVDVLWVVHAGKGAEEGASNIWSHSFYLSGFGGGATYYVTNDVSPFTGNPVRIDKYIIMPERTNYADGNSGTTEMIGCGVFCHEFGHALGLPDLYDTGGYPISGQGLGNFSLMAGGSWGGNGSTNARPVALDLWCRRFLGWASPVRVATNGFYSIPAIMTTSSGSSYKLAKLGTDTTRQYWLIENRYRNAAGPVSGVRWDSLLAGQGLAIYHIDSAYANSTYIANNNMNVNTTNGSSRNRPYGVALEETDQTSAGYSSELWDGSNAGESADLWNNGTQATFDSTGTSYPISQRNGTTPTTGGGYTGVKVRNIPAASAAMSCSLIVGVVTGVEGEPQAAAPLKFSLNQANPNPVRSRTIISFQLPEHSEAGLSIFNVLGQEVKRFDLGVQPPGRHSVEWNAAGAMPGVYFYQLKAGNDRATGKLTVIR